MPRRPSRLKLGWQDADRLIAAIHSQRPVSGLTHNFYKYPARFSPEFAGAAIDALSDPGDLVLDPFVGGGTTLVESRVRGRLSVGTDVSTLANFVSRAKTQILSNSELESVQGWCVDLPEKINLSRPSSAGEWSEIGYTRNLECRNTWAIRKAIEVALSAVGQLRCSRRQTFARCLVLRAAQWAIDGRKKPASVSRFRSKLESLVEQHVIGATEFSKRARRADRNNPAAGKRRSVCFNGKAESIAYIFEKTRRDQAQLVVTSPPYPGVHVLYHRWQTQGGKETPAPFWIANQLDGSGEAFYLMHARRPGLNRYLAGIEAAYASVARVCGPNATIVQLVAFSDPMSQLPRYLEVMSRCGFHEHLLSEHIESSDGRIWRNVPRRKWHANSKGALNSGKEVVLIHRPA